MYEKIPKRFLESVDNPNFNIHKLKIPFRLILAAPSGSGKTSFLFLFEMLQIKPISFTVLLEMLNVITWVIL